MGIDVKEIHLDEYDKLHELAFFAWKKSYDKVEHDFFDIYDKKYLDFNLNGPRKDRCKLFGAYWKNRLVGSCGVIASNIVTKGEKFDVMNITWMASFGKVIREMLELEGDSAFVWEKIISDEIVEDLPDKQPIAFITCAASAYYCLEKGFHGLMGYFEVGHSSYDLYMSIVKSSGEHLYKNWDLKMISAIVGTIDVINPKSTRFAGQIRKYEKIDLPACLELLNSIQFDIELAQVWEKEELAWQLEYKDLSETFVFIDESGKIKGLINYLILNSYSKDEMYTYAVVDNLHVNNLTEEEKKSFIIDILVLLEKRNFTGLIHWTHGYCDETFFYNIGFVPDERKNYQSFCSVTKDLDIDGVSNAYLRFR